MGGKVGTNTRPVGQGATVAEIVVVVNGLPAGRGKVGSIAPGAQTHKVVVEQALGIEGAEFVEAVSTRVGGVDDGGIVVVAGVVVVPDVHGVYAYAGAAQVDEVIGDQHALGAGSVVLVHVQTVAGSGRTDAVTADVVFVIEVAQVEHIVVLSCAVGAEDVVGKLHVAAALIAHAHVVEVADGVVAEDVAAVELVHACAVAIPVDTDATARDSVVADDVVVVCVAVAAACF